MLLPLLLAIALHGPPQEQVEVSASLTETRIFAGGRTTLQITVETRSADPDRIIVPRMPPGLEIIGTRDFTQTQISVPGGRTRLTNRDIVLRALAPGLHRIPPVRVIVDGREFATEALSVLVTGTGPVPDAGTSSSLEVVVEPDTVYVGEQVLLRAQATFSEDARLRQSRPPTFLPPAPTGFWVQEIPDPVTVTLRVSEGRSVETQTFRRAYFPLSAGEFRLPPARLQYEVRRGFLYAPVARELVSDSARVVVLPLPGEERPSSFSGAVGSLTLRAELSRTRVAAGEPAMLTVEIEGAGNVKALPTPRLPGLEHAEVFPPTQETRVDVAQYRVGGLKRFRWTIVPQQPGELVIPPIEYAVFDPELETYVVLRSDTLRIDAAPVVAAARAGSAMRGLRRATAGAALAWVRTPAFAALQLVPLLLLTGALRLRRRRHMPPSPAQHAQRIRAELAALRNRPRPDLAAAERVLVSGVLRMTGSLGHDPVAALRQAGRDVEAVRLQTLLRDLQDARYAPHAATNPADLIDRADALIRDLAPRRRWSRSAGAAVAVAAVAIAAVALAAAASHAAAQNDAFRRGVALYEDGEFVQAAAAFGAYASARPADVAGWYDLGLAAWRADDHGRAVWAWLRAARVAPRDADVRHNLGIAGANEAAQRLLPPDRLSSSERALAAGAAWWLLLLGLAGAVLGRKRGAWIAVPAAVVLAGAAGVATMLAARPQYVVALSDGARTYAAPTLREESLALLEPGSLAVLVERRGDWLLVRQPGGEQAWVERAAVASP
ncbi:MAG: BatD family protein [Gemmatimonadota bacterium]